MQNGGENFLPLLPPANPFAVELNPFILFAYMSSPTDDRIAEGLFALMVLGLRRAQAEGQPFLIAPQLADILLDSVVMKAVHGGRELAGNRIGATAGFVLLDLLQLHRTPGKEASLNKALHLARHRAKNAGAWGDGAHIAQTTRQIRAHWDESRSVAHLWAARHLIEFRYGTAGRSNYAYETHFLELLRLAEGLRLWLETFIPERANGPLCALGELWRPDDLIHEIAPIRLADKMIESNAELDAVLSTYKAPTSKFFD